MRFLAEIFLVLILFLAIIAAALGITLLVWHLSGSPGFTFATALIFMFAVSSFLWVKGMEKVRRESQQSKDQ